MPEVSIIIPTHKGAPIDDCVKSVKQSSYKDIEIIIVDEGLERSKQRNIGIGRAKGEYLLFLDSDHLIHKELIGSCVDFCTRQVFKKNNTFYEPEGSCYDALYIPEVILTRGWFGTLRRWERSFYIGTPVDCVRFVRAKNCPFFDHSMSGPEDADWDRRIQGEKGVVFLPLYHLDHIGFWAYLKKKAYYSKSMARFAEKWPNDKVLQLKWRCWTVFTEKGKWKRLLSHPILSLGLFALIGIRGIIYLWHRKKS